MSNWKKKMSMVLALTLILSLTACGGQTGTPGDNSGGTPANSTGNGGQQVYVMKVNSVLADASPNAQGLHMFEEYVEEKSGGQIDVQLYTGGTLAASDELSVEMCMSGGCEMVVDPTFCLATKISDAYGYMFTCYPYIWKNRDSAYRYMNESKTMSELAAIVEEQTDLKIMGWYDIGYNVVANNKRALKMPGDGAGLKCRVASIPIMLQTLEAFGPTGVAMAYGEVYTAMTQGTVDAVQTSTPNLQADLFYEQCNHVTLTNHYLCMYGIFMNDPWFNSLPANLQEAVEDACEYLVNTEYELYSKAESDTVTFLEGQGIEVITFEELDYDAWYNAAMTATEANIDDIGRDFYNRCMDEIAAIEQDLGLQ